MRQVLPVLKRKLYNNFCIQKHWQYFRVENTLYSNKQSLATRVASWSNRRECFMNINFPKPVEYQNAKSTTGNNNGSNNKKVIFCKCISKLKKDITIVSINYVYRPIQGYPTLTVYIVIKVLSSVVLFFQNAIFDHDLPCGKI